MADSSPLIGKEALGMIAELLNPNKAATYQLIQDQGMLLAYVGLRYPQVRTLNCDCGLTCRLQRP